MNSHFAVLAVDGLDALLLPDGVLFSFVCTRIHLKCELLDNHHPARRERSLAPCALDVRVDPFILVEQPLNEQGGKVSSTF